MLLRKFQGEETKELGHFPKIQLQLLISKTWVSGLLNRITEPGLIFTVIRIIANIVEMNFYYKISFNKYMYNSNFTLYVIFCQTIFIYDWLDVSPYWPPQTHPQCHCFNSLGIDGTRLDSFWKNNAAILTIFLWCICLIFHNFPIIILLISQ